MILPTPATTGSRYKHVTESLPVTQLGDTVNLGHGTTKFNSCGIAIGVQPGEGCPEAIAPPFLPLTVQNQEAGAAPTLAPLPVPALLPYPKGLASRAAWSQGKLMQLLVPGTWA